MAASNLNILEEFNATIQCVTASKDMQSRFVTEEQHFTRNRKVGFDTVTYLILGLLKKSLNIELKAFFSKLKIDTPHRFSKGAFSQRRHQITSKWFKFLLEYLGSLYYEAGKDISLWKGYKILAVDGSSAILVKGKELDKEYKGGKNKYGTSPMCRYMKMYDILNQVTLKAELFAMTGSERLCAYRWVDYLPHKSITLYDRGFPSFTLFYLMQSCEKPKDFIVRCKKDFSNSIKEFVASKDTNRNIKFYPDDRAVLLLKNYSCKVTKTTFIELRAEKILLTTGEVEILVTSIMDDKLLSNAEMKVLYNKRWEIETAIGKEKNLLQLENFSSHTKNGVEQDFYATLIAGTIHSIIAREAQKKVAKAVKGRKYKYKVNASASMHEFKYNLVRIFYCEQLRELLEHMQSVFELFIEPVRPNRSVERKRISKRRYGKHQTHKNYRNNM